MKRSMWSLMILSVLLALALAACGGAGEAPDGDTAGEAPAEEAVAEATAEEPVAEDGEKITSSTYPLAQFFVYAGMLAGVILLAVEFVR